MKPYIQENPTLTQTIEEPASPNQSTLPDNYSNTVGTLVVWFIALQWSAVYTRLS